MRVLYRLSQNRRMDPVKAYHKCTSHNNKNNHFIGPTKDAQHKYDYLRIQLFSYVKQFGRAYTPIKVLHASWTSVLRPVIKSVVKHSETGFTRKTI